MREKFGAFATLERQGPRGWTKISGAVFWAGRAEKRCPYGRDKRRVKGQRPNLNLLPAMPKIADFSKTGSRNMAKTWAIDFSYATSYSTSIVLGGLRRLLLSLLTWADVDLENFRAKTAGCSFGVSFQVWSPMEQKLEDQELWFLEP